MHRSRAVPVDEPPDDEPVERGGRLHRGVGPRDARAPAEGVGERRQEHAPGVEEQADVDGEGDESGGDDEPAVHREPMLPAPLEVEPDHLDDDADRPQQADQAVAVPERAGRAIEA
jgi:hypothetical protein